MTCTRVHRSASGASLRSALNLLLSAAALATALGATPSAQAQVPADPYSYSRTTSYSYDAKGRLQTETIEPDTPAWCVVSTHGYDAWGNRNTTTQANCAGAVPTRQQFASRTSSVNYTASQGLFPNQATNALNQSASTVFDARFGVKTSATDLAGLTTNWQLDDFGRPILETRPDGTKSVLRHCYIPGRIAEVSSNSTGCDASARSDAPIDAVFYVETENLDKNGAKMSATTRSYKDRLGRELRTVSEGFDGADQPAQHRGGRIATDTLYSPVGTKVIQTRPYYLATQSSTTTGANDQGLTLTEVDPLGRVTAVYVSDPQGLAGNKDFGLYGSGYGSRKAAVTRYSYNGLTTSISNDKGQVRTEERNAAGMLVRITDPSGAQLVHQHDAFGNLVATKDPLGNRILIQFDIRGRRLALNDPDAGLTQYDYNALGEAVWSQSANQRAATNPAHQATTMAYDKLGRMTSRVEPEGTGTWSYDKYADNSACANGAGRLCESRFQRAGTSDVRATKTYYDALGRITSDVATVTNGPTMATAKSYDPSTGRLATKTYPTGLQVGYGYTALGYPEKLKLLTSSNNWPNSLASNTVLWQAQIVNAWGKAEQQKYSNGVTSRSGYEAATGRATALSAGTGSSGASLKNVLDHSYAWDSLNNLTWRADHIGDAVAGAVTETFEYADGLSRLTKYTVAAPAVPGGSRSVTLSYNALGMLLHKSDVGSYTYNANGQGAVRPHALASIAGINGGTGGTENATYGYDANGNLISATAGKYRSIAYTSFNLPDSQNGLQGAPTSSGGGQARYSWQYDENHQRIKEVRVISGGSQAGTRTTWYLHPDNAGNLGFEYEVTDGTNMYGAPQSTSQSRHYLSFGGRAVGVLISDGAPQSLYSGQSAPNNLSSLALSRIEYWHKDHLGSLAATTNQQGGVTARYAYDPFGKRRFTNGQYDAFGTIVIDWSQGSPAGTDRGFTEHEHLDDVGIVHMNGRLFDPNLGRFLQADPKVTFPENLQNYNRYQYCLNNPLTCTDPTGLDPWYLEDSETNLENARIQAALQTDGLKIEYKTLDGCSYESGAVCISFLDDGRVSTTTVDEGLSAQDKVQTGIDWVADWMFSNGWQSGGVLFGTAATAANEFLVPGSNLDWALAALGPLGKLRKLEVLVDLGKTIADSSNYRQLFMLSRPDLPAGWQVHHSLPQRYEELMRISGLNVHDIQFLRGVDPGLHAQITNEWAQFHRAHGRDPTAAQVAEFAKSIDEKYGDYFVWPGF